MIFVVVDVTVDVVIHDAVDVVVVDVIDVNVDVVDVTDVDVDVVGLGVGSMIGTIEWELENSISIVKLDLLSLDMPIHSALYDTKVKDDFCESQ